MSKRMRRERRDKVRRNLEKQTRKPRLGDLMIWDSNRGTYVLRKDAKGIMFRIAILLIWIGAGIYLIAVLL